MTIVQSGDLSPSTKGIFDSEVFKLISGDSGNDVKISNYIGGEWKDPSTAEFLTSTSPIDGQVIAQVPASSKADMDAAISAAKAAYPTWSTKFPSHRADLMLRLAQKIKEHLDLIAHYETLDTGTLYKFNKEGNIDMCIKTLRMFAAYATNVLTTPVSRLVSADHGFLPESEKVKDVLSITSRNSIGVSVIFSPCTV